MEVFFGVAAFVLLIVTAAFVWQLARNAYFWLDAQQVEPVIVRNGAPVLDQVEVKAGHHGLMPGAPLQR
jgi:hypothetical protein